MVYDACLNIVDVTTLGAASGRFFMTFVCWSIVDVSTLSAVSGHMFMNFFHMVYNMCWSIVDISH